MINKHEIKDYKEELNRRYWDYKKKFFYNDKDYFDRSFAPDGRPLYSVKELRKGMLL